MEYFSGILPKQPLSIAGRVIAEGPLVLIALGK